jgi:hypothetical protein
MVKVERSRVVKARFLGLLYRMPLQFLTWFNRELGRPMAIEHKDREKRALIPEIGR